jgi:hypothetical protein
VKSSTGFTPNYWWRNAAIFVFAAGTLLVVRPLWGVVALLAAVVSAGLAEYEKRWRARQ